MSLPVTPSFTLSLPKIELHAHLTGSLLCTRLHELWTFKRQQNPSSPAAQLTDPLLTIRPLGQHHSISTFFPLFDTYIYALINDIPSVRFATSAVLADFFADGVAYLELRTTPRECLETGLTKEIYVQTVLETLAQERRSGMATYLILSIDRRNSLSQALETVDLAIRFKEKGVVGVDLCGNPLKGDVSIFGPAFQRARAHGLRITLHFAEMPHSSSQAELRALLSYEPDRIGHVVHVDPASEREILERRIGLELCLSCNVHAKMTEGGFGGHHFGKWYSRECPVALCVSYFIVGAGRFSQLIRCRRMMSGSSTAPFRMST